jgi:hypothetical protein
MLLETVHETRQVMQSPDHAQPDAKRSRMPMGRFDAAHQFAGSSLASTVLHQQGCCLGLVPDPDEVLSPGQAEEIERQTQYPELLTMHSFSQYQYWLGYMTLLTSYFHGLAIIMSGKMI